MTELSSIASEISNESRGPSGVRQGSAASIEAIGGNVAGDAAVPRGHLLAWLMGPVAHVTTECATLGREMNAEDTTVATLRFASGALGLCGIYEAAQTGREIAR